MTRTWKFLAPAIGLLILLAMTAPAADVGGKWSGEVVANGNSYPLTLSLKVEGDKLTGTVTGPQGEMPISEGKVDGDSAEWVLNVDANGTPLAFKCSGKLTGADELNVKMTGGEQMTFEFTAKRTTS